MESTEKIKDAPATKRPSPALEASFTKILLKYALTLKLLGDR